MINYILSIYSDNLYPLSIKNNITFLAMAY